MYVVDTQILWVETSMLGSACRKAKHCQGPSSLGAACPFRLWKAPRPTATFRGTGLLDWAGGRAVREGVCECGKAAGTSCSLFWAFRVRLLLVARASIAGNAPGQGERPHWRLAKQRKKADTPSFVFLDAISPVALCHSIRRERWKHSGRRRLFIGLHPVQRVLQQQQVTGGRKQR